EDDKIKERNDLKGKQIGVQLGTTEDLFLSGLTDLNLDIRRYQRTDDVLRDVVLGRVEAALVETPVALSYINSDNQSFKDKLKVSFGEVIVPPEEGMALVVRKDDPRFLEALNKAMSELESNGKLDELRGKYNLK
ncbi:MAG: transporter substrate-binding domain-containing protein, partial [Synergistaceae bacterium]|nr:transporter substrate-binding domain-containing protein [Synergistaceae bacterium]